MCGWVPKTVVKRFSYAINCFINIAETKPFTTTPPVMLLNILIPALAQEVEFHSLQKAVKHNSRHYQAFYNLGNILVYATSHHGLCAFQERWENHKGNSSSEQVTWVKTPYVSYDTAKLAILGYGLWPMQAE